MVALYGGDTDYYAALCDAGGGVVAGDEQHDKGDDMKLKGTLRKRTGHIIEREAESVILITSTVAGSEPGTEGTIFVDHETLNAATFINMVGELLVIMEEQAGENVVAQAIAHYAYETGKTHHVEGEVDIAWIRGRKNDAI